MIKIPNTMAKLYSPIISILLRFYSSFGFLSGSRIGIIDLLLFRNFLLTGKPGQIIVFDLCGLELINIKVQ